MDSTPHLLRVQGLHVWLGRRAEPVRAVDGVSFSIPEGETVALVGESGCGKTVTALSLARLIPPAQIVRMEGRVLFRGEDVLRMDRRRLGRLRGGEIAYVFQEPGTALNPVLTIGFQIKEALRLHRPEVDAREEAVRLLKTVGIADADRRMRSYPFQLSGGMAQRAVIAMALACRPSLLVADEPTTALDATIQAQIVDLLADLQEEFHMAVLLITHNLGLVADVAHFTNVMYAGQVVESGRTEEVIGHPQHPYTRGLLAAVPRLDSGRARMTGIDGAVPNPARLPAGCRFAERCVLADAALAGKEPEMRRVGSGGSDLSIAGGDPAVHLVRCHCAKLVAVPASEGAAAGGAGEGAR